MNARTLSVACLLLTATALPAFAEDTDTATTVAPDAAPISWTGSGLLTAKAATIEKLPFETVGPPAIPGNPVHPIVPGNPVRIILPGFGGLTSSPAE